MKTQVFVTPHFTEQNKRLQPWRYIFELANRLPEGHQGVIYTNGPKSESYKLENTTINVSPHWGNLESHQEILNFNPLRLWWSVAPGTLRQKKLITSLSLPVVAINTSPYYSWRQLLNASLKAVPWQQSRSLVQQKLIPKNLYAQFLNLRVFEKVVVSSGNSLKALECMKVKTDKLYHCPVGIDDFWLDQTQPKAALPEEIKFSSDDFLYLYLGGRQKIRGLNHLLKAFGRAALVNSKIRLLVLARDAHAKDVATIYDLAERIGIKDKIQVIGNLPSGERMSPEQLKSYMQQCSAVVLPFLLVPSDTPIAILEALAQKKPVISSQLDGIPELVEGRGRAVPPYKTSDLAMALAEFPLQDLSRIKKSINHFIEQHPTWQVSAEKLYSALDITAT